MITTAERRRPPVLAIALLLSLLVHVVGLLIYAGFAHQWLVAVHRATERKPPDEMAAISDRITLERRTVPRAARRGPPPSVTQPRPPRIARPPIPRVVPQPVQPRIAQAPPVPRAKPEPTVEPTTVPTPAVRREVARLAPKAQPQPTSRATHPPHVKREVAYAPPAQTAPEQTTANNRLTPQQIATYTQAFKQTIARASADLNNAPPPKKRPATMKKYAFVMSGKLSDLSSAQGDVHVLEAWTDRPRGLDVYYVRVYMVYSDGTSEIVDIPWQVEFPMRHDPLATHEIFHHIPEPPAGFVLPHPFQLSRLLCLYYRAECQAVIDAEGRNGGAPGPR